MAKKKHTDSQLNKYALCLFHGLSQRQAYLETFPKERKWKDATIDTKASKLAKSVEIVTRLDDLKNREKIEHEKNIKKEYLTRERKQQILFEIASDPEASRTDRIKAIDVSNKMDGEYITRTEITGNIGLDQAKNNLDDLIRQMVDE